MVGLDKIDSVFFDFLKKLQGFLTIDQSQTQTQEDDNVNYSIKAAALQTILIVARGSYQSSLTSFFFQIDFFDCSINLLNHCCDENVKNDYFNDEETVIKVKCQILSLLGILSNFDKLQSQNPYLHKLTNLNFTKNENGNGNDLITGINIINTINYIFKIQLIEYSDLGTNIQEINSLSDIFWNFIGWNNKKSDQLIVNNDLNKENIISISTTVTDVPNYKFLPSEEIISLLMIYDLIHLNKSFCLLFLNFDQYQQQEQEENNEKEISPLFNFFSFTSFLFQYQHKNERARIYTRLCLLIMRCFVNDYDLTKELINENLKNHLFICRHKNPPLKYKDSIELSIDGFLDSIQILIRFNLTRRFNIEDFKLDIINLYHLINFLKIENIRIDYNWDDLWETIFQLFKFISSQYEVFYNNLTISNNNDSQESISTIGTKNSSNINDTLLKSLTTQTQKSKLKAPSKKDLQFVVESLFLILYQCLKNGDIFIEKQQHYDDLFYKLLQSNLILNKLILEQFINLKNSKVAIVLLDIISHYSNPKNNNNANNDQNSENDNTVQVKNINFSSSDEVEQVIKQGYDTLSLPNINNNTNNGKGKEDLNELFQKYKEGNERLYFKKLSQTVIKDADRLLWW